MILPVKIVKPNAKLPVYAHATDAGMDLFCPDLYSIPPEGFAAIPLGIKVEVPEGHVGLIMDKSSLALKGLHVVAGVVDSGYRGEVTVVVRNLEKFTTTIYPEMKIAQMLIMPVPFVEILEVSNVTNTVRGTGGFGSTGAY